MKQSWFYRFERKYGKYRIEGFMRYVIAIEILGAVLNLFLPGIYYKYLCLDYGAVFRGQIWRLVTFVLYPGLASVNVGDMLLFALELYIYYSIGNTLERVWGAFRFNCYYISGLLMSIIGGLILYVATLPVGGIPWYVGFEYIDLSLMLAFVVMFPDMQFLLMFLIPVKAKWLGIFYVIYLGFNIINCLSMGPIGFAIAAAIIVSMLNFVVFYTFTKNPRQSMKNAKRKREFNKQMGPKVVPIYRHRCAVCGRTEKDDENLEFRFCSKCDGVMEYCSEHIYTHEHVINDNK